MLAVKLTLVCDLFDVFMNWCIFFLLLCVHAHAFSHLCHLTVDHRLAGSDQTFLGNYPVKDKNTPEWIFTSADGEEVNTG